MTAPKPWRHDGGHAGGHLVRVLPAQATRRVLIVAGTVMTVFHAWTYWR